MSVTAGWLILAVLVLRFLFKKAPKWITCMLWAVVAIRLICPLSFESVLSVIPSAKTINVSTDDSVPYIQSGVKLVDSAANTYFANINNNINANDLESIEVSQRVIEPKNANIDKSNVESISDQENEKHLTKKTSKQKLMFILAVIWIAVSGLLILYGLFSFIRLRKTVAASIEVEDNVFICDDIRFPFILGVFKPIVYLPSVLDDAMKKYVLAHENAHLKRRDHWWKPLGYLLLSIHWFNPLCWVAYILFCRDIEMACDEKVIKDMDTDDRAGYSQALLNLSCPKRIIAACPVAFGEIGVKERVKGVIKYKKPAYWLVLTGFLCVLAVSICFLTDPKTVMAVENDESISEGNKDIKSESEELTTQEATTEEKIVSNSTEVKTEATTEKATTEEPTTEEREKEYEIYGEDNPQTFNIARYGKMSAVKDGQYIYYSGTYQELWRYDTATQTHELVAELGDGGGKNLVKYGDDIYLVMNNSGGEPEDNYICRVSAGGDVMQLAKGSEFVIENDRIYYTKVEYTYDDLEYKYDNPVGTHSMKLNGDDDKEEPWVTLNTINVTRESETVQSEYGILTWPIQYNEKGFSESGNIYFVDNAGESRLVQEITLGTQVRSYMMLDDYIFYVYHYHDDEDTKKNLVIEKYDGSEKNETYMGIAAGAF
ncbi:MAG: hypothetical protein IKS48_10935 [Eubacterium sp.]|nr:hypothetical protein [Eubacterium sp.]